MITISQIIHIVDLIKDIEKNTSNKTLTVNLVVQKAMTMVDTMAKAHFTLHNITSSAVVSFQDNQLSTMSMNDRLEVVKILQNELSKSGYVGNVTFRNGAFRITFSINTIIYYDLIKEVIQRHEIDG